MASPITCTQCQGILPAELLNTPELIRCPHCEAETQVEFFPALLRAPEVGSPGERIATPGESGCFYHPLKKAAVACDACGRFLCALCDCELNGRHYCPVCLEAGKRSENIRGLEEERFLYDRQAFVLAILPVFITGLAALYLTLRYWKAPGSLVSPSRWRMPAALALGILQVLGIPLLVFAYVSALSR